MPVMNAARLGAQTPAVAKTLVYLTPSAASLSGLALLQQSRQTPNATAHILCHENQNVRPFLC